MCGRFGLSRPERLDLQRFGISEVPSLTPRFNIPPGSDILTVRQRDGTRGAEFVRWGLIPSWAKDPDIGNRLANARSDTAFEKPSFRAAMKARRCLIPADLFYEWKVVPGQTRKQPFAIRMAGGEPFAIGGLWEFWRAKSEQGAPEGDGIVSCTILTTEANTLMSKIHDRMPVIVPPERFGEWLDPRTATPAIQEIMRPFDSEGMESWPVSLGVNNPKNDNESVMRAVEA
ncbi:MAG: SOS response-associated peptidase [Gemmatimonadaceae bacterium]